MPIHTSKTRMRNIRVLIPNDEHIADKAKKSGNYSKEVNDLIEKDRLKKKRK